VTGGAGSVGRPVVEELVQRGHEVTAAGRTPGRVLEGAEYITLDCTDYEGVLRAVGDHDTVVHLAAIPSPRRGMSHEIFESNVLATHYVFDACVQAGIKKIAVASSINALGQQYGIRPLPVRYFPIDEDHPQLCTDAYSFSKKIAEEMADYFWLREGISSVSLRLTHVVAPGSRLWRYLHERGADVEADHQVLNYWTWVDARDSARAFAMGIEEPYEGAHALFINDDVNCVGVPSRELADRFYPEVTDWREPVEGTDTLVSVRRAKEVMGWEPIYHYGEVESCPTE